MHGRQGLRLQRQVLQVQGGQKGLGQVGAVHAGMAARSPRSLPCSFAAQRGSQQIGAGRHRCIDVRKVLDACQGQHLRDEEPEVIPPRRGPGRIASRHERVHQSQESHRLSLGFEPGRDQGRQAAAQGPAEQVVGAGGLYLPHHRAVVVGHLLQRAVSVAGIAQAAAGYGVDGAPVLQGPRQRLVVKHRAEPGMHAEQRWCGLAHGVERHDSPSSTGAG